MQISLAGLLVIGVALIAFGLVARRSGGIGPILDDRTSEDSSPSLGHGRGWFTRLFYPEGGKAYYERVRRGGPMRAILFGALLVVVAIFGILSH
jgi:hypothetical protein